MARRGGTSSESAPIRIQSRSGQRLAAGRAQRTVHTRQEAELVLEDAVHVRHVDGARADGGVRARLVGGGGGRRAETQADGDSQMARLAASAPHRVGSGGHVRLEGAHAPDAVGIHGEADLEALLDAACRYAPWRRSPPVPTPGRTSAGGGWSRSGAGRSRWLRTRPGTRARRGWRRTAAPLRRRRSAARSSWPSTAPAAAPRWRDRRSLHDHGHGLGPTGVVAVAVAGTRPPARR